MATTLLRLCAQEFYNRDLRSRHLYYCHNATSSKDTTTKLFQMIQLESLTFDVHLTILNFLEPLDILRLRKTCTTLHHTTLERIVWINALHRVCVRNSVFMPTFPIHDMSQPALEYAATVPERFLRTVAAKGKLPEPRSHHIIQFKHDALEEMFIVPGGRYLVIVGLTKVAVWDLGIPGLFSLRCSEPICNLPTNPDFGVAILLVHPTDDGRGLIIFVNYELNEIIRFTIFRIYPSDKLPSLQQIAEVDIPHPVATPLAFCSLTSNKVIYLIGSTLNVWDFAEDAWASFQVPNGYIEIMVSESAILVPYSDHVLVWKMPSLSTSKPLFAGSIALNIAPAFTLKIPGNQTVDYCRGPCNWYSGSSQPLLFDFLSALEFPRFQVSHENENFKDSVITTLGWYRDLSNQVLEYGRFCNGSFVCWWVRDGHPEAHVATLPFATNSRPSGSIDCTIRLVELDEGRSTYFPSSLCPISGRFAYADEFNWVRVVDYFSDSLLMWGIPRPQDRLPSPSNQ